MDWIRFLRIFRCVAAVALLAWSTSCADSASDAGADRGFSPASPFDAYLSDAVPPSDGFDFPVGDRDGTGSYTDRATGRTYSGWYVATSFGERYALGLHPGEDWNGAGGGNTDIGQEVRAIGNGRVVSAADCGPPWGNVVVLEHAYFENDERKQIHSLYAHLGRMDVRPGVCVQRRQRIGTVGQDPERRYAAHLHLEVRRDTTLAPTYWPSSHGKSEAWVRERYADPRAFIRGHRSLPIPNREPTLVLVDHESYQMRIYKKGIGVARYDVSLGQGVGEKRREGDNKTPKGMYYVVAKHRGDFPGFYGRYYGGYWIKINYPNAYDAARGRAGGVIHTAQERTIAARWSERRATLEATPLGGGIGLHGWVREWEDQGPRHLSWGCVVLHLRDIAEAYDLIPVGAMVVIM